MPNTKFSIDILEVLREVPLTETKKLQVRIVRWNKSKTPVFEIREVFLREAVWHQGPHQVKLNLVGLKFLLEGQFLERAKDLLEAHQKSLASEKT